METEKSIFDRSSYGKDLRFELITSAAFSNSKLDAYFSTSVLRHVTKLG